MWLLSTFNYIFKVNYYFMRISTNMKASLFQQSWWNPAEHLRVSIYIVMMNSNMNTCAKALNMCTHITAHSTLRSTKKWPESNFLYPENLTYLMQLIKHFLQEFILFFCIIYSFRQLKWSEKFQVMHSTKGNHNEYVNRNSK